MFDLENKACCPFSIIVKTENELEKCLVDLEKKKKLEKRTSFGSISENTFLDYS